MNRLLFWGFTNEEQAMLVRQVNIEQWVEADLAATAPEQVWVVAVSAAPRFLEAERQRRPADESSPSPPLPSAVLWVPDGEDACAFEEWSPRFARQLLGTSDEDRAFLERLSRCPRVLHWHDRVEAIAAHWFAALSESPRLRPIDELPFSEEERQHVKDCEVCAEEAYGWLQHRAQLRWTLLCPTLEEISTWLEAEEEDEDLQTHAFDCALCQETIKRQAWLCEGAGLLTAEQVETKCRAVGIPIDPSPWLLAEVVQSQLLTQAAQVQVAQTEALLRHTAQLAALLLQYTALQISWQAVRRRSSAADEIPLGEIEAALRTNQGVSLEDSDHWVSLTVDGETVVVQAGTSEAEEDRFPHFCVEFQRGADTILSVEAVDGAARLDAEMFRTIQQDHADRLAINPLD